MECVRLALFQMALLASWLWLMPPPVAAFVGIRPFHRGATATINYVRDSDSNRRRCRGIQPSTITAISLGAKNDDEEEGEFDPLSNDQREGMADAFSALDSLTANDFDDLRPLSSISDEATGGSNTNDPNMEESAKLFMEMQAELSTRGDEGVYDDILGDLTGADVDAPTTYLQTEQEEVTGLGQALDEAADALSENTPIGSSVLSDADGLGTVVSSTGSSDTILTTADVSNDVLNQEIKPSLSVEDFMSSALQEAVDDIAKTAEQLLEDQELRKEIENIFDRAGEKLRLEVKAMKKEQEAVTQSASKQGLEYLESEKQRISEAEESVTRLIQKVASETESVQKAMEDLEFAKNEASGEGGSGGSIEDTALDLKKGGIVKQASLVGALLFGSRAITETILVLGSPYGDEHFLPAILQAAIALACVAYFALVK